MNRTQRRKSQAGFSFLEIVLVLILVVASAVSMAFILGPQLVSISVEDIVSQIVATVNRVRWAAISNKGSVTGVNSSQPYTVDLLQSVVTGHPGIIITATSPIGVSSGCATCSGQNQSICISGDPFCYNPATSMTFETVTGHLDAGHVVYVVSASRKFAVYINEEGYAKVAELRNGQWVNKNF